MYIEPMFYYNDRSTELKVQNEAAGAYRCFMVNFVFTVFSRLVRVLQVARIYLETRQRANGFHGKVPHGGQFRILARYMSTIGFDCILVPHTCGCRLM